VTDVPAREWWRHQSGVERVTNVELFFDLMYAFAVTQLSRSLLSHQTLEGALQTALLLAMVWLVWVYTTWVTNYLDPQRLPVRMLLLGLMLVSLVMSASLPQAFGGRGLAVGAAYATMQIGRSVFAMIALRGHQLQRLFQRVIVWCLVSGTLAVVGGLVSGHGRELLWLGAVGVDLLGGAVGFYTPGLGRSTTGEWTIEGGLFAERCQAFLLIALGESVIVIGTRVSELSRVSASEVAAVVVAFVGAVLLWWLYFDRSAEDAAGIIGDSSDPGRLGRSAYHFIHPIMVAGIIVTAAADEQVLAHPLVSGRGPTTWMVLGGTGLFLAGHALFKGTVWRVVPWTRIAAIGVLARLAVLAPHVAAWVLGACAGAVILAVAVADRILHRAPAPVASDDAVPAWAPTSGR
jgi:low temperature requirement protein LtrA